MVIRTPDIIVAPVPDPTMDQISFWLRIMKEHSLFIKLGLPCDQTVLIAEAEQFYALFEMLEREALCIVPQTLPDFIIRVRVAVEQIWVYKRFILHSVIECRFVPNFFPLLIDHISREAAYFIKVLDKLATGQAMPPIDSIVQENVFWLRIMGDHAKFVRGLLDPSERKFLNMTDDFSREFDMLLAQARDLESMLWDFQATNSLRRFEGDVENATIRIRDFKRQALELLQNCAVLSEIPPLLADHVRREAEHFLEVLEMINQIICAQPVC